MTHTRTHSTTLLGGVQSRIWILLDVLVPLLQTLVWRTINFNWVLGVFCCIFWWKCTLVGTFIFVEEHFGALWTIVHICIYWWKSVLVNIYIAGRVFWCTHTLVKEYSGEHIYIGGRVWGESICLLSRPVEEKWCKSHQTRHERDPRELFICLLLHLRIKWASIGKKDNLNIQRSVWGLHYFCRVLGSKINAKNC